jgi:hypothetical protein
VRDAFERQRREREREDRERERERERYHRTGTLKASKKVQKVAKKIARCAASHALNSGSRLINGLNSSEFFIGRPAVQCDVCTGVYQAKANREHLSSDKRTPRPGRKETCRSRTSDHTHRRNEWNSADVR